MVEIKEGFEIKKVDGNGADNLKIEGLSVIKNERLILDNLSCTLPMGKIIGVIGPSGGGKTTLLRILAKLEAEYDGYVGLRGRDLRTLSINTIGMVFQQFHLFPHKTVLENLTLAPIHVAKMSVIDAQKRGVELLAMVGLLDKQSLYPHHLSGGQKQRVAIARALMMDPELLLFDEPTSALDPEMVSEVAAMISKLKSPHRLVVVVTNELRLARLCTDEVIFLEQGKLCGHHPTAELFRDISLPHCPLYSARLKEFIDHFN